MSGVHDTDGNLAALTDYMAEQDRDDKIQEAIDERTQELIEIHTSDIDDMVLMLIEDDPDTAQIFLKNILKDSSSQATIDATKMVFEVFIETKCKQMAEKESEK